MTGDTQRKQEKMETQSVLCKFPGLAHEARHQPQNVPKQQQTASQNNNNNRRPTTTIYDTERKELSSAGFLGWYTRHVGLEPSAQ